MIRKLILSTSVGTVFSVLSMVAKARWQKYAGNANGMVSSIRMFADVEATVIIAMVLGFCVPWIVPLSGLSLAGTAVLHNYRITVLEVRV